jgi:hypothetical protein
VSEQCYASFQENNPGLRVDKRDYLLSRLFQFLFVPITTRHDCLETDGALRHELEGSSTRFAIPPWAAVGFDWKAF